jgi:L-2-hydroxyglutarate oxidase
LRVPQEGIVDFGQVCEALVRKLTARGASVVTCARVQQLERRGGAWLVHTLGAWQE